MSKHTPGPWRTIKVRANGHRRIITEQGNPIAVVPDSAPADARLIAAAPEMYELLRRVATSTNSGYGSVMSAAALADTLRDLSSQAKQLMAKIEGGRE